MGAKKKDPNKTKTWFLMVLKNGVILRALFLRSHFIEILLYASKISKSWVVWCDITAFDRYSI